MPPLKRHARRVKRRLKKMNRRELVLLILSAIFIFFGGVALWASTLTIPDIGSLTSLQQVQSTKIYDRTGKVLLYDMGGDITRTVVPIDQISPYIQEATVSIEDQNFYHHNGIEVTSMIRAALSDIFHLGYAQGGSTIDQQVVKNTILTQDKSITRKVKEIILALKLDATYPKDKILEIYLNDNPYGGTIYGVEEASEEYFGVHASDVDLAEAAYLAAMPQAPTYYSPYGNNRAALDARKNLVLSKMESLGYITKAQYDQASQEVVAFEPQAIEGIRAPHFVFYVIAQLEQEYGAQTVEDSGWRVITTLDADLESKAEQVVQTYALSNEKNFNASNAALVAIDPKTGDILTMAGSRNFFDTQIDGEYNVAVALRQPGSTFKPFIYAQAFLDGYTPDTVLFDVQTEFSTDCPVDDFSNVPPCYTPTDYDGNYIGPLTIRDALAQSRNVPAVKTLYLVGITPAINLATSMGITTLGNADQYGLTLVLGGGDVTLLDMTSAYGVFANAGVRNPYRSILQIEDASGNVIQQAQTQPQQVLDQNVALTMSDVLSDNVARTPELGADSPLYFPGREVAAKTGTTNDYRDAWTIGYTPDIVVGAWAGNNDDSAMDKKIAGFVVAPLWNAFVQYALTKFPNDPFPEAPTMVNDSLKPVMRGIWQGSDVTTVDATTLEPVPDNFVGATKEKIVTAVHDILYWVDKNDPNGPVPANPNDDPQFARWEYGVRLWAAQNGYSDGTVIYTPPPPN